MLNERKKVRPLERIASGQDDMDAVVAERADFFQQVPDLRLLKTFPDENIKILEAWIPAGERISLPHNAHEQTKS